MPLRRRRPPVQRWDVTLLYTANGTAPTEFSDLAAENSLTLTGATVVRAMAVRDGWEKSPTATRSDIFLTSVLGTAANGVPPTDAQTKPEGWPE